MKKSNLLWAAIIILAVLLVGQVQQVNSLKWKLHHTTPQQSLVEYYQITEKLLEDLEYIDNLNDIDWGDTIMEGDTWWEYVDAKEAVKASL